MRKWYVLTTAPQRERWVGAELYRSTGIDWYVPLERSTNTLRGRFVERVTPLIPGYVFVADVEEGVWRDVADTRHVSGWLTVDGEAALIYEYEISRIKTLEKDHNRALIDRRQPQKWIRGNRAMITDGPFATMERLLLEVRGSRARVAVPLGSAWVPTSVLAPVA